MTPGLRERKKAATRAALRRAALTLAVERGASAVTVEDIAAAADVSPRTFFNYFASKEEAFVADDLARAAAFVAAVAAAPDDAAVWPLLHRTAVVVFAVDPADGGEQALKAQLVRSSPEVLAHVLATTLRLEDELVAELRRRTASSALQARLLSNGVAAALRAAMETWSDDAAGPPFPALLDEAFDALAPAFPT